jgi:hypothetical protein
VTAVGMVDSETALLLGALADASSAVVIATRGSCQQ